MQSFNPKCSISTVATANTLVSSKNAERILSDLDGVFKEFSRVQGILKSRTIAKESKKKVDQTRWRKNFKRIFDIYKCLNFDEVNMYGKASLNVFARTGKITSLEP